MKIKFLLPIALLVMGGCATTSQPTVNSKWITPSEDICQSNYGEMHQGACKASWENAQQICSSMGGRLPSIRELRMTILNCGGELDKNNYREVFERNKGNLSYQSCYKEKNFISSYYWSSTKSDSSNEVLFVNFKNGGGYGSWRNPLFKRYIQCIKI